MPGGARMGFGRQAGRPGTALIRYWFVIFLRPPLLRKRHFAVFQGFRARPHCENSYLFDSVSDGETRLIEALRSSAGKVTFDWPGSGSFSVWQGICREESGPLAPQFFSGIAEEW